MSDAPPSDEFLALQAAVAGRFSLERELGRGGMGIVFLAHDVALDRPVAIKVLPPHLSDRPDIRERFLREARTAGKLSHPNIVAVHSVEDHGELVFFVMAYVEGETLGQRVGRAGPMPPSAAVRLLQEVAWALAYAHGRGVVHRDVKPDNILIDRGSGRAMVTDFGIARVAEGPSATVAGELVGTAAYMSPEQASGEAVDGRSDLYSLGVTGFLALAGRLPFEASSPLVLLGMHVRESAPPLASVQPNLPQALAQAMDRCLAKDPASRFQSGEELAETLGASGAVIKEVPPVLRHYLEAVQQAMTLTTLGVWAVLYVLIFTKLRGEDVAGVIGTVGIFLVMLWLQALTAARRLVRGGMRFDDVRTALADEARAKQEEWLTLSTRKGHRSKAAFPNAAVHRRLHLKFGGILFRVAGLGLKPAKFVIPRAVEPTEVVLADAAGALFQALPAELRSRLPDVPAVLERLESDAERLRKRRNELRQTIAEAGLDQPGASTRQRTALQELRAAGEAAEARLATVVTALENIRLDLLRFKAGVGTLDDLTADLAAAREIQDQIDLQLAAADEVRQLA